VQFESLAAALGDVAAPLPEMTYPRNGLVAVHEASGWTLKWDAAGGLAAWHAAQTADAR